MTADRVKPKHFHEEGEWDMGMTPTRPATRHIVLFVIACVLLVTALSAGWDLLDNFLLTDIPAEPPDDGTGMGLAPALLGEVLKGFALFVLLAALIPVWCGGLVISVLLVMNRTDKPRWLWAASLVLTALYAVLLVGLLAVWLLT
jgi:hypothetical protein